MTANAKLSVTKSKERVGEKPANGYFFLLTFFSIDDSAQRPQFTTNELVSVTASLPDFLLRNVSVQSRTPPAADEPAL